MKPRAPTEAAPLGIKRMTPTRRHDAEYVRARAAHARQLAAAMKGSSAQAYMQRVADDYERPATPFSTARNQARSPNTGFDRHRLPGTCAMLSANGHSHGRSAKYPAVGRLGRGMGPSRLRLLTRCFGRELRLGRGTH
jgi:hypothetical protein